MRLRVFRVRMIKEARVVGIQLVQSKALIEVRVPENLLFRRIRQLIDSRLG